MSDYISRYADGAAVDHALDLAMSAVQPETGKGLSSNDFTNEYKQKVDDNSTAISGLQNRTTTLEGSVNTMSGQISKDTSVLIDIVNNGPKNKLKNAASTITANGITFTVNTDGTFTANGTATATALLQLNVFSNLNLQNGNYILSGCPEGGSANTYRLDITRSPGSSINDIGSGVLFLIGSDYVPNQIRCVILKDTVCVNLLFKPMICTKAEWDISNEHVPYRPSYDELIAMIEALQT
jgi:hypothetical protein